MENDWFPKYFEHLPFAEAEKEMIDWCVNKEQYDLEKVLTLIINNEQQILRIMQSVAQQYVSQGIAHGVQKGRQDEIFYIAKNMLKNHVDITFISNMTALSMQEIKKL